jgi:hypothetical protein
VAAERLTPQIGWYEMLVTPTPVVRWALVIGLGTAVLQQVSPSTVIRLLRNRTIRVWGTVWGDREWSLLNEGQRRHFRGVRVAPRYGLQFVREELGGGHETAA